MNNMSDGAAAGTHDALAILEDLGLSEKEARVLAALVTQGSASAAHLAQEADLYRTNVYPVLEALEAKRLVGRFSGKAGVWSSAGRDQVIDRLYTALEQRNEKLQASREDLRTALTAEQEADPSEVPRIELVHGPTETGRVYDEMLHAARDEVLVFNRPPYGVSLDTPSDSIVSMLARGVRTRVLYRSAELDDDAFRAETEVYLHAGVEARVTDELPTKLVVVDRRVVLVAVMESDADDGFPLSQHADHVGFAAPWAAVFERYWATSTPYAEVYGRPARAASTWSSSRDAPVAERSSSST